MKENILTEKSAIIRKVLRIVMALLLSAFMISASGVFVQRVDAAQKNKTSLTIYRYASVQLKPSAAVRSSTWKSSNSKVASVTKKGIVKGKKAGTATISVKYKSKTWKWKIRVKEDPKEKKARKLLPQKFVKRVLHSSRREYCSITKSSRKNHIMTYYLEGSIGEGAYADVLVYVNLKTGKCTVPRKQGEGAWIIEMLGGPFTFKLW